MYTKGDMQVLTHHRRDALYILIAMPLPQFQPSFGSVLRQRRDELGLTKADVAERGGPAGTTLGKLESNQIERPRAATFAALDQALDWSPGTSARLFHTGRAAPHLAHELIDEDGGSVAPGHLGLVIEDSELADLITWNTLLSKHVQDNGDATAVSYTSRITEITNALLGRWIDQAISRGHDVELRLLVNILASQPMVAPEHPDYTDQLYRRWRLGIITDEQINPAVLGTFRARRAQED